VVSKIQRARATDPESTAQRYAAKSGIIEVVESQMGGSAKVTWKK
jgi:hypothetical protein